MDTNTLHLSENLIRLRHERDITQEELANFIGVTKASVSKWETGQSFPDILLLPQLASFFDITLDSLVGYEPQLSREQIRHYYHRLAEDFANKPFDEVMHESERLVKKYYCCYPFLEKMCVLWINHFMLAKDQARQQEIIGAIAKLCDHILNKCKNLMICNNAVCIKVMTDICTGRPQNVIDTMEEWMDPNSMKHQSNGILIQAYLMTGAYEKADQAAQADMYLNVIKLVGNGGELLLIHEQDLKKCEEIIARIDKIIEVFKLDELNPNSVAGYQYQAAIMFCSHQEVKKSLERLEYFVKIIKSMLRSGVYLHGDDFFDQMDDWFQELDLGIQAVRDKKLIIESATQALDSPRLQTLPDRDRICRLKKILEAEYA